MALALDRLQGCTVYVRIPNAGKDKVQEPGWLNWTREVHDEHFIVYHGDWPANVREDAYIFPSGRFAVKCKQPV